MIQRLTPPLGRLYEDSQVLLQRLLPDELVQRARPQGGFVALGVLYRVQRPLNMSRPRYILRHLVHVPQAAAHREVVHLLHAVELVLRTQRLPPIRRNASLTYLCTESCGGISLRAFSASSMEYPSAAKASRASTYGPPVFPPRIPGSNAARFFPRSSSTSRSAVFLPSPGTDASFMTSPRPMASAISCGENADRIAKASFGPILLTPVKESNAARSPLSAKPNRSIASSRTTIRVCSTHSSPIDGSALKVAADVEAR